MLNKLKNKLLAIFKRHKKAHENIPKHEHDRLIDKAYCQGAARQREIDLEIIDNAIDTCGAIQSWSEAARRARSDIARQVSA